MVAIILVVLLWFGLFTVELFYILVFLGLLITLHLFAPVNQSPPWYRRLTWLSRLGFLGLAYIVYRRAAELLPNLSTPI